MPRRIFKPLSRQRRRWQDRWFMKPFRVVLEHPAYWALNRRNVTRAFALGLFISFVPLPVHVLLAAALALLLRLNVPAAMLGTFLSNPVTIVPMFLAAYWIGCQLLDVTSVPLTFELSWDWLSTQFLSVWKPFLLGCLVLGALTATLGYALLATLWHGTLVMKYHRRKAPGGRETRQTAKNGE